MLPGKSPPVYVDKTVRTVEAVKVLTPTHVGIRGCCKVYCFIIIIKTVYCSLLLQTPRRVRFEVNNQSLVHVHVAVIENHGGTIFLVPGTRADLLASEQRYAKPHNILTHHGRKLKLMEHCVRYFSCR